MTETKYNALKYSTVANTKCGCDFLLLFPKNCTPVFHPVKNDYILVVRKQEQERFTGRRWKTDEVQTRAPKISWGGRRHTDGQKIDHGNVFRGSRYVDCGTSRVALSALPVQR